MTTQFQSVDIVLFIVVSNVGPITKTYNH